MEREIDDNTQKHLLEFLGDTSFFANMRKSVLKKILKSFKLVQLAGGEVLIRQNEQDDSLYIVIHGRLRIFTLTAEGEQKILGEAAPGEVVGEIALLLNEKRTATVQTIRDSVLVKLEKSAFEKLIVKYPEAMMEIARAAIKKLLTPRRPSVQGKKIVTLAIAPSGATTIGGTFVAALIQELKTHFSCLHLNRENCDKLYGEAIANTALHSDENQKLIAWLHEQEEKYQYIIYETEQQLTPWSQRCLRQADHVLLIAKNEETTYLNEVEQNLFSQSVINRPYVELIIVHPEHVSTPSRTGEWLTKRDVNAHHHVKQNTPADIAKLRRIISGQALGLVLGGGGARGFAHVGVIKALTELDIPIDFIGGTSMGAILAGAFARTGSWQGVAAAVNENFSNYKNDYTFPLLSLVSGKWLVTQLQKVFGKNQLIEDLWIKYFCVSTNISKAQLQVHHSGLLWRSIRASISLPAVFPPIAENGELLIDGAVMNNLPVDIMRQFNSHGTIIAVSLLSNLPNAKYNFGEDWHSGWSLLLKKLGVSGDKQEIPSVAEIIIDAMMLSSIQVENSMKQQSDCCISIQLPDYNLMDFKSFDAIIESGYQQSLPQLEAFFSNHETTKSD